MDIRFSAVTLALALGLSFASDARFEQAERFIAKGDYDMALGEYRSVLAEQPQTPKPISLQPKRMSNPARRKITARP